MNVNKRSNSFFAFFDEKNFKFSPHFFELLSRRRVRRFYVVYVVENLFESCYYYFAREKERERERERKKNATRPLRTTLGRTGLFRF